jgi:hypothetical protein
VRFIRKARNLTYETEITYLTPYWLAWSSRKRVDGKPYDPSNLTWLTEWAVNGSIPPISKGPKEAEALPHPPSAEETRKALDGQEKQKFVPPPADVLEKIRGLKLGMEVARK